MLDKSLCPEAESKIYTLIVENIHQLDAEIHVRLRKGTHLEKFNNLQVDKNSSAIQMIHSRIQTKQVYSNKMRFRN